MNDQKTRLSRRTFLRSCTAAGSLPLLGPRLLRGKPGETLNVACVGVGGMGGSDLRAVASSKHARIVALCDVDGNRLARARQRHDGAKTFRDYRTLFDREHRNIDAVVVSTPDHMHGSIAIAAMQLGKHVYCQKPIAHNLFECRAMAELARAKGLVTQMGTQIHSHAAYRTAVATLRTGVIGRIREAHLWVSKSWAGPPKTRPAKSDRVPPHLDWDLWLGVAAERPYVKGLYHPAQWRRWIDFGSGTLGDMGCHIFDPLFTALRIRAPRKVVARGPRHFSETFAPDSDVVYEFPGTELTTDMLRLRWTDGRKSRPDAVKAQLPEGHELPHAGSCLVGEKGTMVIPHISMPELYLDGEAAAVGLERRAGRSHYHEWIGACRGEGKASTPFSYAGPLTEAVLLGTVAGHFPHRPLVWYSDELSFGEKDADAFVRRSYREGWEI